ncbi:MAG: glyoxalase [Lachnospiraceae bacterium]|nr:glyoxalase [Lachnospiraceae bacterium]
MTDEYDEAVLQCFLDNQRQLFSENIAESAEEAEAFLEDCMAVVVDSPAEVLRYFEEEGIDTEGAGEEEILEQAEVFDVGDGRYLIVEG